MKRTLHLLLIAVALCMPLARIHATDLAPLAPALSLRMPATITPGSQFPVDVMLDTHDTSVNAVEIGLAVPAGYVYDGYEEGMLVSFVDLPSVRPGQIYFSGIIPGGVTRAYDANPGGTEAIKLIRLFITAPKDPAATRVAITLATGTIYRNDGDGTPVALVEAPGAPLAENSATSTTAADTEAATLSITLVPKVSGSPSPTLAVFATEHAPRGVDHYEITTAQGTFVRVENPYPVVESILEKTITVRSVDQSGTVIATTVLTIPGLLSAQKIVLIALLLMLIFVAVLLHRREKKIAPKSGGELPV